MADEGQMEQGRVPERQQGSPVRRFLRKVGASIGSVVSNPMTIMWDSPGVTSAESGSGTTR